MRYDEIHAHVQRMLREDLAQRLDELTEKGHRATYTSDRFEDARALLAKGSDAHWENVGSEVVEALLGRFARTSGAPREEVDAHRPEILKLLHHGAVAVLEALEGRNKAIHSFDPSAPA